MEPYKKTDPNHQENQIDPQENEIDGNVFKAAFNFVFGASKNDEENKDTDLQDRAGQSVGYTQGSHEPPEGHP